MEPGLRVAALPERFCGSDSLRAYEEALYLVYVLLPLPDTQCPGRVTGSKVQTRFHLCNRRIHWLRVPERIKFKLAVIVYRALNGTAPRYLAEQLSSVAGMPSRSRLRSSSHLVVRPSRLVTAGDRSFATAGPIKALEQFAR